MALYLYLLAEGVCLLYVFIFIPFCRLFLFVYLSVGWLSIWISWLKESVCPLITSVCSLFLLVSCFCLSLHSLPGFYLYLLARGVGLLSLVGIISVCRLFLLVSLSCLYLDLLAEGVGLLSLVGIISVCRLFLLVSLSCLYLCLLAEGVGLLSLVGIISVCRLFLHVSSSVGWLSTWISWLKESAYCLWLWLVSYMSVVCFCLSLYLLYCSLPGYPG
jgi:hypothetical protein